MSIINNRNEFEEPISKEISLRYLISFIFKKWRLVLYCVLFLAIVGLLISSIPFILSI